MKLSLASYAWARRLQYNGIFSDELEATRRIGAGAAPATFELVCHVLKDIRAFKDVCNQFTEVELVVSLHVDDLATISNGTSRRMVAMVTGLTTKAS